MQQREGKYDSVLVADYLLSLAKEKEVKVNVTKAQKLLYAIYGAYLAMTGDALTNEHPKAWPYGPVFPRARKKAQYANPLPLTEDRFEEISKDSVAKKVIEQALEELGSYNAKSLTDWSHAEGSPWYLTTKRDGFDWNSDIPDDLIKSYFKRFVET